MEAVRNVIVLAMVGAAFAAVGAEQTASEIKEIRFKALTAATETWSTFSQCGSICL